MFEHGDCGDEIEAAGMVFDERRIEQVMAENSHPRRARVPPFGGSLDAVTVVTRGELEQQRTIRAADVQNSPTPLEKRCEG